MHISADELQEIINIVGTVFTARKKELAIGEDVADSDLTSAQEETTDRLNDLKRAVAEKIKSGGINIMQEGDALAGTSGSVTMPQDISCDC